MTIDLHARLETLESLLVTKCICSPEWWVILEEAMSVTALLEEAAKLEDDQ